MQSSETQEVDGSIQWSLLTKIKAAATAYKADSANTDSLHSYLRALENLAEYVGTRQRGSVIFQEMRSIKQRAAKPKRREPIVIPFDPPVEASDDAASAVADEMSLAG